MLLEVKEMLENAKVSRGLLKKKEVHFLGQYVGVPPGEYFKNYAAALLNRQIDVFDDALFLLEANRIPAACVVSRGMIEAYAVAQYSTEEVRKILLSDSKDSAVEKSLEKTLAFINSSRFKKTEQDKYAKGVFSLDDYQFTSEAKDRIVNATATAVHVQNALRYMYAREMEETGKKESRHELYYDGLSEWVHPSQTSLWHCYAGDVHMIETSLGKLHVHDVAMSAAVYALHFITASHGIYTYMLSVGDAMNKLNGILSSRDAG